MNRPPSLDVWIDVIENTLAAQVDSIFRLITDPLRLTYGEVEAGLHHRGWECFDVETPLDLRYLYEKFRRSDLTSPTLVRLKFDRQRIPFDILEQIEPIDLIPSDLFPGLNPVFLTDLPARWYAKLIDGQGKAGDKTSLSPEQTVRYILQTCLAVEFPDKPRLKDFLNLVVKLILQKESLPASITNYFVAMDIPSWLADALSNNEHALASLQTVWINCGETFQSPVSIADKGLSPETLEIIPILEKDMQLQEGFTKLCEVQQISPIQLSPDHLPLPHWLNQDIHYQINVGDYLARELDGIEQDVPVESAGFDEWGDFAKTWAAWRVQQRKYWQDAQPIQHRYADIHDLIQRRFFLWLRNNFDSYIRYPYLPKPSCVHHVLPYLANRYPPSPQNPLAIVIMDGMAWEDWLILEKFLQLTQMDFHYETFSILAFLPTLTSISRQALLSAQLPHQFSNSWQSTHMEGKLWASFWQASGLESSEIGYVRGLGKQPNVSLNEEIISLLQVPNLSVAAIIVNGIDDLIHSSSLTDATFQGDILSWANQIELSAFLHGLLQNFSTVVITSDHGHITGKGIGKLPYEHMTVEDSLRAGLFTPPLAKHALDKLEHSVAWSGYGLPDDLMVVFPKRNGIFASLKTIRISHGGPALEEVVIPLTIITALE